MVHPSFGISWSHKKEWKISGNSQENENQHTKRIECVLLGSIGKTELL